ncbi:hypothetical protein ACFL22_00225 [Patescibacteria group bacterium]
MAKSKLVTKDGKVDTENTIHPKFFSFIREGEGMIAVNGESLHKILISSRSHKIIKEDTERDGEKITIDKIVFGEPDDGFWEKYFRMYCMGPYPFVTRLVYKFAWSEWDDRIQGEEGSQIKIRPRNELTDFFYVKTADYAMVLEGVEIKGNISITIHFSLFLRIVYPRIALFWVENWLKRAQEHVLREGITYFNKMGFEEVRALGEGTGGTNFIDHLKNLNGDVHTPSSLLAETGAQVEDAKILKISLVGDENSDLAKAMTAVEVAKRREEASKYDARAIENRYKAAASVPGGIDAYIMELSSKTNLVSYGGNASILVNTDNRSKKEVESEID